MLEEALEHLVKGIVEHPDEVRVRERDQRRGKVLEVRVHPDDLGKVIGRGGRTARALPTVMAALGGRSLRGDLLAAGGYRGARPPRTPPARPRASASWPAGSVSR